MTKTEAHENLDYLKSLAEQGAKAPLLGGRIGLMWNILLVPTLCVHGLATIGKINLPENRMGLIWLVFGVSGGILSAILSRNIGKKPGTGSTGNRIESIIWPTTALLIFAYAFSIMGALLMNNATPILFNTIMPFAFALGAVNYTLLGRITGQGFLRISGLISALFMVLTMIMVNQPSVYFLSALGVLFTGVLPSVIQMSKEPSYVV